MLGLLGGTFDPVHDGHLYIAKKIYTELKLSEIRFIPCYKPVFEKTVAASREQRLTMLQLALQPYPFFTIDKRELDISLRSYTYNTLHSLREELDDIPLALIIGNDILATLDRWYRWTELLTLTHLIIISRQVEINFTIPAPVTKFIKTNITRNPEVLKENSSGYVYISSINPFGASSTHIRKQIANGDINNLLLPQRVLDYILTHHLYQ